MKKIAFLLPLCLTQTVSATAELTFSTLKSMNHVGECISLTLQENLQAESRFHRVDLWAAVQLPSSDLLFMTPLAFQPFSSIPQFFSESLEATKRGHNILDFEVIEGLAGTYTFYAAYVEEGKNPLTDGDSVYQSNLAQVSTALSDDPPLIPAKGCAAVLPTPTEPGEVFRDTLGDGRLGPEMVMIPAGSFRMGDIQGDGFSNELPVHQVSVNAFVMGRYEVTFEEYDRFSDATGREKPDDKGWGRGNRPVMNVSWEDATAYAAWLSLQTGQQYRLPTEAEWEYAARAGTKTQYWWGNEIGSNQANCRNTECRDRFKETSSVGSFAANPFGLYDTVGNVLEWTCSDYESSYNGKEEYCNSEAGFFVTRGGSWHSDVKRTSSSFRFRVSRTSLNGSIGFRLARLL